MHLSDLHGTIHESLNCIEYDSEFVSLGDNAVLADDVAATQGPALSAGPTPGRQLHPSDQPETTFDRHPYRGHNHPEFARTLTLSLTPALNKTLVGELALLKPVVAAAKPEVLSMTSVNELMAHEGLAESHQGAGEIAGDEQYG